MRAATHTDARCLQYVSEEAPALQLPHMQRKIIISLNDSIRNSESQTKLSAAQKDVNGSK